MNQNDYYSQGVCDEHIDEKFINENIIENVNENVIDEMVVEAAPAAWDGDRCASVDDDVGLNKS